MRLDLIEMVVNASDLEASREQTGHDAVQLRVQEHEIAHHHRLGGGWTDLFEGRVGAQGKARLNRHALHGDLKVGARHTDTKHLTLH